MESSIAKKVFKSASFSFYLFIVTFLLCPIFSEGLDLLEECQKTEDSHVTRGNFTCCSNSPRGLPLESSLDFQTGWRKCAVEPESVNEDPVISAWRVYRCIIFQGIYGKPLIPTTFTDLLAAKYPAIIKSKILNQMAELEDGNMNFEVDVECLKRTPYPKVHLLHNLFYDVEQEICEAGDNLTVHSSSSEYIPASRNRPAVKGSNSKIKTRRRYSSLTRTDLGEILCEVCDRSKEFYHRNGDCCSHVSIPFPFIYLPYRYGNNDRVGQCAEDLVDDVGLPGDTEFSSHLQYLCYASCEHYLGGSLEESDLWAGPKVLKSQSEIKSLVMKMMPIYFSSKYKQNIVHYVLGNFRLAWAETKTFESWIQISQMDSRNLDREKLKNLLASCKTHKLIETIMNLYLNNLCLESYPLRVESNTTTPSSFIHAFPYPNATTPPSTAVSNDEVTLNLEWGTPSRDRHHKHIGNNEDSNSYGGGGSLLYDFENQTSRSKWRWPSTDPPAKGHYIKVFK